MSCARFASVVAIAVAIGGATVVTGCPAPTVAEGEGEGEGEGAAGEGEGEGEGEGALGAFGAVCTASSQCASGTCTPFQENQPQLFADTCSKTCSLDFDCSDVGVAAFCDHTSAGNFCIAACTSSTDCDAVFGSEGVCDTFSDGEGCSRPPVAANACLRESDCAAGTHCRGYGGDPDRGFCADASISGLPAGSMCNSDGVEAQRQSLVCRGNIDCPGGDVCSNGFCVVSSAERCDVFFCTENSCEGFCTVDADCPANNRCEVFHDGSGLQGFCEKRGGSGVVCNKESDCTAPGEHCGLAQDATTADEITVCRAADAGDVDIGERCGDDPSTPAAIEASAGCVTNFCDVATGACAALCDQDGDCGAGAVCDKIARNGGTTSIGVCVEGSRCTSDADCDPASFCVDNTVFDGIGHHCSARLAGALAPGASCARDVDSGAVFGDAVCFGNSTCNAILAGSTCDLATRSCRAPNDERCDRRCEALDERCSSTCGADADCGVDGFCAGIAITTNEGLADEATSINDLCLTVPGSRAACTKDADCATSGEVCQSLPDATGAVEAICAQPWPDGAAVGAVCGADAHGQVVECAEGVCIGTSVLTAPTCAPLCAVDDDCAALPGTHCHGITGAVGVGQTTLACF
ncbi:MAG TPA: hypothetical protein VGO62_04885 [Myxococcota bacterium]